MRRRILLFHRTLKQSGAARQLVNLFGGLDRERFDPFFVLEHDRKLFYREALGDARVLTLEDDGPLEAPERLERLRRIVEQERPDLIQSFNYRANRYFYELAGRLRVPPLFTSVRNTEARPSYRRREALYQWRRRMLVVNSRAIRRELIRSGVLPWRMRVIPNGVDLDAFRPVDDGATAERAARRARLGLPADEPLLICVGRVAPQKDLPTVLRALAALAARGRRLRFVNLGLEHKAEHARELEAQADALGIGAWCAFREPVADPAEWYRAADAMILASVHEGLPNVLIENMACGGVSIVSSSADNDDVVQPGVNGLCFPVGDFGRLAEQIERALDLAPDARRAIGARARQDVAARFSIRGMVEAFEALYMERTPRSAGHANPGRGG